MCEVATYPCAVMCEVAAYPCAVMCEVAAYPCAVMCEVAAYPCDSNMWSCGLILLQYCVELRPISVTVMCGAAV